MPFLNPDKGRARGGTSGAVVASPAALTSTVAAGATPTKAEFDALRTDLSNTRTALTNLLTSLRDSGQIKTS